MSKERKLLKFITELIRKTMNNEIKWEQVSTPRTLITGTDVIIPICYEALIQNKYFIVFKRRYKHYLDYDEYAWAEEINIATIEDDEVTWENVEVLPNLRDLFIQIQDQVSGIDDFLDSFLS